MTLDPPRYTSTKASPGTVYALVLKWPNQKLILGAPLPSVRTVVTLLGHSEQLAWSGRPEGGIMVDIPRLSINDIPCLWAWVFKMTYIKN